MKVILIQGAENTGKTTLCNQIDEWLQKKFIDEYFSKGDERIEKMVVTKDISLDTDFFALYDIKQIKNINHKRIIINSLSDEVEQFYKFKEFFEEHKKEKTDVVKDVINSCFDILLEKEKEKQNEKKKSDKKKENEKELNENIDKLYEKKEECLKKIFNDVDAIKEEIIDLDCDEIMKRISQSYTLSEKPDLLITTIRPSGTDINKIIEVLNLDDLEELKLSPKTICSYKKDAKDNLLIQLEKIPLELIKEEIKKLFK
jgi:hypothetical protein